MTSVRRSYADMEMENITETLSPWMVQPVQMGRGVLRAYVYPIAVLREHQVYGS